MRKISIILYGPPGSGKGTQANLLAAKMGLIHFDTGRFLEALVHDPERQKEKFIRKERKLFDTGKLMTPSFVLREVQKQVRKIARAGWGIVFSGSPRTMYEAKGLLPILGKLYARKNIFVFVLRVREKTSVARNSSRLLCSVCKAPLLTKYYPSKKPKYCPICAGAFYKRTLDNPAAIKVRLKEYRERTKPIFKLMKDRSYRIREINGESAPWRVFSNIYGELKNRR